MHSLQSVQLFQTGPVSGEFRLRDVSINETRAGRQYLRIFLEDARGSVPAYLWKEDIYRGFYLPNLSLVRIEGQGRYHGNLSRIDLHAIEATGFKQAGDVVRLIPQSFCPIPKLLSELQSAINRITLPVLRRFVEAVLADDSIAFPFVSAPASLNHHHNYPGGLLKHSLECYHQMVELQHGFRQESYELGLISSLFHDIGKVLTLTQEMTRTSLGQSADHDKLTLELLRPYLAQLEQSWPAGEQELRYLLTWKVKRPALS